MLKGDLMNKREFLKLSATAAAGAAIFPATLSAGLKNISAKGLLNQSAQKGMTFSLPALPYEYNALEPYIDAQTMEIHYSKHHQGYVNKLNKALEENGIQAASLEELISGKELIVGIRNNGGGHYNHSLFWKILTPGGANPSKEINDLLKRDFGSKEDFEEQLINAGGSVFGSGWAWLCSDDNGKLFITTTPNQDNPQMVYASKNGTPLLGIDVWEHAYYLKYQNRRSDYLNNIVKLINWTEVEKHLG